MNGICPIFSNIQVNFCFIMNPSRALHFFFFYFVHRVFASEIQKTSWGWLAFIPQHLGPQLTKLKAGWVGEVTLWLKADII